MHLYIYSTLKTVRNSYITADKKNTSKYILMNRLHNHARNLAFPTVYNRRTVRKLNRIKVNNKNTK